MRQGGNLGSSHSEPDSGILDAVHGPGYTAMVRASFRQHLADDEFSSHSHNMPTHALRQSSLRRMSMSGDGRQSSLRHSSRQARHDVAEEASGLSFIDVGKKASLLNSGFLDRASVSDDPNGRATHSLLSVNSVPVWIQIL
jgi:hypothetical protein